jgi:hypothetical protein
LFVLSGGMRICCAIRKEKWCCFCRISRNESTCSTAPSCVKITVHRTHTHISTTTKKPLKCTTTHRWLKTAFRDLRAAVVAVSNCYFRVAKKRPQHVLLAPARSVRQNGSLATLFVRALVSHTHSLSLRWGIDVDLFHTLEGELPLLPNVLSTATGFVFIGKARDRDKKRRLFYLLYPFLSAYSSLACSRSIVGAAPSVASAPLVICGFYSSVCQHISFSNSLPSPPPPPSPHKLASLTATMNIRQRKAERHKEALQKLSQEGGNRYCFDCEMRGPLYVVSDFNILVCSSCSAVHRSFQHKVKGITMSEFNEDEMARFMLGGNDVAKKVWHSTFRGKHPRSGDVLALKDFIRGTFIDRRYCDQIAYDKLIKSWENPQAALAASSAAASPPPSTTAATTTLPRLPASAGHRTLAHPATSTAAPQRDAPPPSTETAAPAAPLQPAQNDVFDDLFAAPVQAPVMPHPQPQQPLPSSSAAAAATAPAMTTTMAPPPPAPPKVSSLVDDLFGGVPASAPALPTSKPTSGYSSAQSQPFPSFGGPSYPPPTTAAPEQTPYMSMCANQAFSSGVPQQPPQQQQQMPQQQFYGYAAPSAQASYANQQNAYDSFSNPVSSVPPTQQQQQQYSGYNAAFGAPPIQMPGQYVSYNNAAQPSYSVPQQQQQQQPSHPAGFNAPPPAHGTHANDPFKNLGDPSVFAHLGGPSTASQPPAGVDQGGFSSAQSALPAAPNTWGQPLAPSFAQGEPVLQQTQPPASQIAYSSGAPTPSMNTFGMPQADASGQGWAAPPSNAASSPNRSRIVVLSVTKSGEPPSAAPSMWQQ